MSGTAILVRAGLDVGVRPAVLPPSAPPSRIVAVILELPGHSPFILLSLYLEDSAGLSQSNLELLAAIGWMQSHRSMPVSAAGDFNMP
eukprot:3313313-Pyramimonas_sp.AAC.1